MDEAGPSRFEGIGTTIRKKRTHTFRRRPDSGREVSSLSSTPPSDDVRPGSSDENSGGDNSSKRKELSLSQCASRFPGATGPESERSAKRNRKVDVGLDELYNNTNLKDGTDQGRSGSNQKRSSEGVLGPANRKSASRVKDSVESHKTMALNKKTAESSGVLLDGVGTGTENKVKKVKLKVGGVTRTIDASSSAKGSHPSDTTSSRHKTSHKGVVDSDNSPHREKRIGLQGIPWKDFSRAGFSLGREESVAAKGAGKNGSGKQNEKPESARRNRRASKKRAADGLDDDDDDDEIRYLEKLKNARLSSGFGEDDEESSRKHRRLSKFSGSSPQSLDGTSSRSGPLTKDGKKRSPPVDTECDEDEEALSDGEPNSRKKKKARREPVDSSVEPKREMALTTRQRALQSGKDASVSGGSAVEFPNGLPPAPSRKPKEQLTEVEQQVKRAEAAQRRKMQNEKAARESEAEAIRKILGQDSSRKKKEDKKKKRVADLAHEKAADELMRASSNVRLVMGPNGTTVTFPHEMGLPSIFTSGPHSYPHPREKCAGPSCPNPYKYRDSKSKLPLCSLQCYKAVQGIVQSEAATC